MRDDANSLASGVLKTARSLRPRISELATEIERERRLVPELVQAFRRAGIFRLCIPRALDGIEADVATMVRVIEECAYADGSAGWCAMIGATSGVVSAYLREDIAREIFSPSGAIIGGVFAPRGKAVAGDGGYEVSGRWPFASGCEHCDWLMGGCFVVEGDGTQAGPPPAPRMMFFRAEDANIIDTWSVAGLCGTGSHDFSVSGLFVPQERSVSLITDRPLRDGPLYAFPVFGLLALGIAGVACGIARRAIDELKELAGAKVPSGSRRRLAERPLTQTHVAEAEAALRGARAYLFEAIARAWDLASRERSVSNAQRADLRLAATNAAVQCAVAVDLMYNAGGGSSIYASSPLQRCFRDIHVLTQHLMVSPATYELTGRLLLGLETDTTML